MATPANPDTSNSVGATDDASSGGLLNTGSDTILNSINNAIASNAEAAQTAATAAGTSASNAATSATTASNKAGDATSSAETATEQATLATNAKNDAETAKTDAETAKTDAETAETNAETAQEAAEDAQEAAEDAQEAAETAESNAENFKINAEAAFDSFDERYLGAKSSDPTVDNDGNALITGALYFNSTDNNIKVYTGSAWITSYVPSTTFAALSGADFTGAITAPSINLASSTLVNSILDEDNMASNSATALSTQQAIKSYVDTQVATVPVGDITAVTAGTGLSGGGTNGAVTLNIDSTVATLTGTQTLTNKTLGATSVTGNFTFTGTQTVDGRDVSEDGTKLDTIEENATADQTGAEIKTAYESQANTNAYTDTDNAKVNHITVTQAVSLDQMEIDIAALENGMVYKGDWNAGSGSFPGSGSAQTGWFYYVSGAGTVNGITFAIGDNIVATTDNASTSTYASNWSKHDQTDAVQAVVGLTGSITKSGLLSALNVEDGADVTDATNVASAGALMDSEVTNLAQVKAFDSSDYATAAQGTLAASALQSGDNVSALTNNAGYLTSVPAQSFSSLTGKPTTISGYGITDAFDGAYGSLTGTPTIPTNNNQLTNGAGYITSVPAQSFSSLTGKPTTISGYGITDVNSNIDTHLNQSTAASGELLSWNGSDYDWISAGGGGDLLAANNLNDVASASTSRTNLGVAIGSDVQAHSSVLDSTTASFTTAKDSKLTGIETNADVTDTANVTAAGALMDSEITNLAQVKAFDSSDYATAAQGTLATNALPKSGGAMTGAITTNSTFDGRDVSVDGAKLDGIEAGATADQTASEIRTLVESATDSNVFTDADHTKLNGIATGATAYSNSDVDTHLNTSTASASEVLSWTGSDYDWVAQSSGGGADLYAANESSPAAQPSATGTNAIAIGDQAVSSGTDSFGIGTDTDATGIASLAIGKGAQATANYNLAIGLNANATAERAIAIGNNGVIAGSTYSTAIGHNSSFGGSTTASGSGATALGGSYASGADSFAAAVVNNTSSYGALGTSSVAIGYRARSNATKSIAIGENTNVSAGSSSVVIGAGSQTTTNYAYALGYYCTSSGNNAFAAGGNTLAAKADSVAMGNRSVSNVRGKFAFASGRFAANGDAQGGMYILRADTTDATPTVLTTNNSAAGNDDQIIAANDTCIMFSGTLVAMQNGAQDQGGWEIKGLLKNDGGTTTLVSSNIQTFADGNGWVVALTADNTNNALAITCTGEAAHNIRWVANISTSEVTYA